MLWFDSQGEKSRRTFFWQQRNVFEELSFRHFSLPSPYRSLPEGERDMKILYSSQRRAFARKDEKATSGDCEVQAKAGSVRWRWWQRRESELDLVGQSQVILFSLEHIRPSQVSVLGRQVQKDNRLWKNSVVWSFWVEKLQSSHVKSTTNFVERWKLTPNSQFKFLASASSFKANN